jgi:uncharacterized membrane protein YeaQ/YmgE (transglycosylase-associated protein family)
MIRPTFVIGALLIALGLVAYFGTGRTSVTALIPAFIGAVLVLLAAIAAAKPGARKHAMHVAVAVSLLGIVGSLMRPVRMMLADAPLELTTPLLVQLATAIVLAVHVVLGVRSFTRARRVAAGG